LSENGAGLRFAENDRDSSGAANALNPGDELELSVEYLLIKKKQSAERLILGRGRYVAINREIAEEGADFVFSHLGGMTFVVEEDETADPIYVGLLGSDAVAFNAQMPADAVQQFSWDRWSRKRRRFFQDAKGGRLGRPRVRA
jgi:hypothetical protein